MSEKKWWEAADEPNTVCIVSNSHCQTCLVTWLACHSLLPLPGYLTVLVSRALGTEHGEIVSAVILQGGREGVIAHSVCSGRSFAPLFNRRDVGWLLWRGFRGCSGRLVGFLCFAFNLLRLSTWLQVWRECKTDDGLDFYVNTETNETSCVQTPVAHVYPLSLLLELACLFVRFRNNSFSNEVVSTQSGGLS
jgi:hypothetical protein